MTLKVAEVEKSVSSVEAVSYTHLFHQPLSWCKFIVQHKILQHTFYNSIFFPLLNVSFAAAILFLSSCSLVHY